MKTSSDTLLTDLYQLTMLQAYYRYGMEETAVFEFFSRKLPGKRSFLLAAGLEQVLEYLENLHFTSRDLAWIESSGLFSSDLVERLADFRFTGDVHAMPEGTAFFPDEPIIRVTASMPEAQLVESRVVNSLHFQTVIATKAARCVMAAPDKMLVDFGFRRAHGAEAGLLAARASYLAGFNGTATVLAAPEFGIPVYGTVAHSFIQAHDSETEALERFALTQPDNVVLLIDTYDTEAGAAKVVTLARRLREQGIAVRAVRLDSGDLAEHARCVRKILDEGACPDVRIFSSGGLDEFALQGLLGSGAPIDGFGIGTHLDTSSDAPYLDCAYKLVEYAGIPRRKRSEGKATFPGRKQVYRRYNANAHMCGDTLTVAGDSANGEALLRPVMSGGKRLQPKESLGDIRERATTSLQQLPPELRNLEKAGQYPVTVSRALNDLVREVDRRE